MAKLEVKNLSKSFGDVQAVKNFNLELRDGEFGILLGPSGCGKTTILRCIAGLEEPDRGEVRIGGETINDMAPGERDISMIFQESTIYPHMSVEENLSLPLETREMPEEQIKKKVKKTLKLLGIENLKGRRAQQLSGGQKQRVAVGKSIVRDPEAFLMDEPLSDLDAKLKVSMRAEIKKIQRKTGTTTLYVTHNQQEAMSLGDKIAVMENGELQQIGPSDEIYNAPSNLFVGTFIGSPPMNIINISLEDGTSLSVSGGDGEIQGLHEVAGENILKNMESRKLLLGARPEHLLSIKKGKAESCLLKGTIETIQDWGKEGLLAVDAGEYQINIRSEKFRKFKVGEKIDIVLPREKVYVFDKETGKCLVNPNKLKTLTTR